VRRVPTRGRCWCFGKGRARFVCMKDIYFLTKYVRNIKYIYFGRHFTQFKYFTYHLLLIPVLPPNYKQHTVASFFRCRSTPTKRNQLSLLLQFIFFSYYYADERNYCTSVLIFIYRDNVPYHLPSRIVRSERRLIQV
jgi:hypothetical protein